MMTWILGDTLPHHVPQYPLKEETAMMELGSGIALAGFCVSAGAVSITAIRTFSSRTIENKAKNGANGRDGRNGIDAVFPCREHSGVIACLESMKENQGRQDLWLKEIAADVKRLLER
jgi:hypothetical protein